MALIPIQLVASIHESAHAVCHLLEQDRDILELVVHERGGHCYSNGPELRPGRHAVIYLAGELRLRDGPDWRPTMGNFPYSNDTPDMQAVKALLRRFPDRDNRLRLCWLDAGLIIRDEWTAVLSIGAALYQKGRLTGPEVTWLWRDVLGRD